MRPVPPHRMQLTPCWWPDRQMRHEPKSVSQMRTSPSLEELASFLQCGSKCSGCQARHVTHFLCPARLRPVCFPLSASQTRISPLLHAEAKDFPLGAQAVHSTQSLWPAGERLLAFFFLPWAFRRERTGHLCK